MKIDPSKIAMIAVPVVVILGLALVHHINPNVFKFGRTAPVAAAKPDEYPIHDDATFTKGTKALGTMPYNKAELEFEIYIPKDWTEEEIPTSSSDSATIIGDIAHYRSPMIGTMQEEVDVQAQKLTNEITAKWWLKNYILANGFTPQGDIEEQGEKSASAYYIAAGTPSAPSTIEYMGARISGSFVLFATCKVPFPLQDYTKYVQKKMIDTFKILYPKDEPIEDQKVFTLVDSVKFNYPASWEVATTDFRDMNRLVVHLQAKSHSKIIEGFIRFVAVRRNRATDLRAEIDEQKKYFDEQMQVAFTKLLSTGKSPAYERFLFNRYESYEVVNKKNKLANPQEVHLVVLGDKEWYVFAFLFTPKESYNLLTWARNTQSFHEIIKSTK